MSKSNGNGDGSVSWKWLRGVLVLVVLSLVGWIATNTVAAVQRNEGRILTTREQVAGFQEAIKGIAEDIREIKESIQDIQDKMPTP